MLQEGKRVDNLIIIAGARRCGTTAMYNYLAQHPMICTAGSSPRQEIHFFDREDNWRRGKRWYESLFGNHRSKFALDKSPTYLQAQFVPTRVRTVAPNAKIIVMTRNPADRAHSDFHKRKCEGYEERTFREAIIDEMEGYANVPPEEWWMSDRHLFGYIERCQYESQLGVWRDALGDDSIFVVDYRRFSKYPKSMVSVVLGFIGLDSMREMSNVITNHVAREPMTSSDAIAVSQFLSDLDGVAP